METFRGGRLVFKERYLAGAIYLCVWAPARFRQSNEKVNWTNGGNSLVVTFLSICLDVRGPKRTYLEPKGRLLRTPNPQEWPPSSFIALKVAASSSTTRIAPSSSSSMSSSSPSFVLAVRYRESWRLFVSFQFSVQSRCWLVMKTNFIRGLLGVPLSIFVYGVITMIHLSFRLQVELQRC